MNNMLLDKYIGDKLIKLIFIISSCGIISIGSFFDNRLTIMNINISIIISVLYSISTFLLLLKIRVIRFNIPKILLFTFFGLLLITTPILWMHFGVNEYGIRKYISLLLLIFPTVVVILETFNKKDLDLIVWVFLSVSFLLMIAGILNIDNVKDQEGGRMSAFGGGPIVYARWLIIGSLILFFHQKVRIRYKIFIIPLFLLLASTTGSRGPFYALLAVIIFYYLIMIRKNFIVTITVFSLIISTLFIGSSLNKKNDDFGATSRVFNNNKNSGYARKDRIIRSTKLLFIYPMGVGLGNWSKETNRFSLMSHEEAKYPHNIIMEITNEVGFIQAIVFILFIIYSSSYFLSSLRNPNDTSSRMYFILFLYMFLSAMISGDLIDSRFLFVFIALYLSSLNIESHKIITLKPLEE